MVQIRLWFLITHHLLLKESLSLPRENLVVFLSAGWVPTGVKLWDCLVVVHPKEQGDISPGEILTGVESEFSFPPLLLV